jgi:hypothetical protein
VHPYGAEQRLLERVAFVQNVGMGLHILSAGTLRFIDRLRHEPNVQLFLA